jgi:hypothetical protein
VRARSRRLAVTRDKECFRSYILAGAENSGSANVRSPHGYQGSGVLVGGDAELGRLRALIDPALEGSRLLVVLGAAGMGKSVLLADTAQRARTAGMRVLAVTGLEPEADLAFAAAVPPGVGRRGRATPATGHGSTGALGFATEPVARDQFLTGIAALTLLSDASKLSPVLVVVDDAHWVAYELRKSGPTWSRDR